MPTYMYRCNDCGHEFNVRQRMTDDALTECPECNGVLRRVVGSVGVVFKGSGFYVTDNRGGKGGGRVQPAASEKSADSSGNDKPSEKKSDEGSKTKSEPKAKADS